MLENVVIALVTGILAVLGSYAGNVATTRKKARDDAIKDAERETRQADRLTIIEKKLDTHNGYADKISNIQKDIAVIKKDIEYLRKEQK